MPPGIPENQTPTYKAAKLAVIILSGLIILALIALVVGGISRLGGKSKPAARTPSTFTLAPGARVLAMESQPGRLILRIRTVTGEEIDIIDTADGRLVSQIKTTAAPNTK
jgi:hypothetical protein